MKPAEQTVIFLKSNPSEEAVAADGKGVQTGCEAKSWPRTAGTEREGGEGAESSDPDAYLRTWQGGIIFKLPL